MAESKVKDRQIQDDWPVGFADREYADRSPMTTPGESTDNSSFSWIWSVLSHIRMMALFVPGSLLSFFMSFGAAVMMIEIFLIRREIQVLPPDAGMLFAVFFAVMFFGSAMAWAGLADVRRKAHLIIPASIIASGVALGSLAKILMTFSDFFRDVFNDRTYIISLLPAAWVVPILAKSFVDRKYAPTPGDN